MATMFPRALDRDDVKSPAELDVFHELEQQLPVAECAEGDVGLADAELQVNPMTSTRYRRREGQVAPTYRVHQAGEEPQLKMRPCTPISARSGGRVSRA